MFNYVIQIASNNYVIFCRLMYTGLASVMKNYAEHERIIMQMSLNLNDIDSLSAMNTGQPSNMKDKSMDHYLKPIFANNEPDSDGSPPILYEISSSGIMELKGTPHRQDMSLSDFNSLLIAAANDIIDNEDCAIVFFYNRYQIHMAAHPRSFVNDFCGFIAHDLSNNKSQITKRKRKGKYTCMYTLCLAL